tara:strand:- start:10341 stop:10745 length:405 start_codon:yes stop_codon:yes gene_type:complete
MTYQPSTQLNPFFSAYRDTSQVVAFPEDYVCNNFINCSESSISGRIELDQNGFIIVEARSTFGSLWFDIKAAGTDELAEGFQVRTNARGSHLMDDAAYGFASSSSSVGVSTAHGYPSTGTCDANEARVMGIRTL